ncbi:MAG: 6,7-dimethyl-8-ribityllumazine synthase [Patescibacteria group bacterium]
MQSAQTKIFQSFDASNYRVAIIRACFNTDITQKMTESAVSTLDQYRVVSDKVKHFEVPGCVEIPLIASALAKTKKFDAIVVIGCVIKGDTPHFDYVCKIVSEGVLRVSLDNNLPIGFGIITVNTLAQAQDRISMGRDAAVAALHSSRIIKNPESTDYLDYDESDLINVI